MSPVGLELVFLSPRGRGGQTQAVNHQSGSMSLAILSTTRGLGEPRKSIAGPPLVTGPVRNGLWA